MKLLRQCYLKLTLEKLIFLEEIIVERYFLLDSFSIYLPLKTPKESDTKKKKVSVQRTENRCIHHLGKDDGRFLAVVYDVRNHIVTLVSLLLMQHLCQGLFGYTAEFTYIVSK